MNTANNQVSHVWIFFQGEGWRIRPCNDRNEGLPVGLFDTPTQQALTAAYDYSDVAHDMAQRLFPRATVGAT